MDKKKLLIKTGKIVLNVLLYLFLALGIFSVAVSIAAKKDSDGTANMFGYQLRFVQSESMEKCANTDVSDYKIKDIPVKSLVFVKTMPNDPAKADAWYAKLKVGDVLTFKYEIITGRAETITHRITAITPKETGGYLIDLAGDNVASDGDKDGYVDNDGENSVPLTQTIDTSRVGDPDYYNYVIGKVTGQSYPLGLLVHALNSPVGIVCIIIIPCFIIIGFEVVRIVTVLTADKKKKAKEEQEKTQTELEELKKLLAAMATGQTPVPAPAPAPVSVTDGAPQAERPAPTPTAETTEQAETPETATGTAGSPAEQSEQAETPTPEALTETTETPVAEQTATEPTAADIQNQLLELQKQLALLQSMQAVQTPAAQTKVETTETAEKPTAEEAEKAAEPQPSEKQETPQTEK